MPPVKRDLVALGASAGGVEALRAVVAGLPPDLPAALLVTMPLGVGAHSAPARTAEHGAADDGAAGLRAIVDRGGLAVVQAPSDALYSGMPANAPAMVDTEHVVRALPAAERGAASGCTCPACQESLTEVAPDGRFRCRIGHAWSAPALLAAHHEEFRSALLKALRALDEQAAPARKLSEQIGRRSPSGLTERSAFSARETAGAAGTRRRFLLDVTALSSAGGAPG